MAFKNILDHEVHLKYYDNLEIALAASSRVSTMVTFRSEEVSISLPSSELVPNIRTNIGRSSSRFLSTAITKPLAAMSHRNIHQDTFNIKIRKYESESFSYFLFVCSTTDIQEISGRCSCCARYVHCCHS